eukprot:7557191-Pyramimonas_sp.AAC.1
MISLEFRIHCTYARLTARSGNDIFQECIGLEPHLFAPLWVASVSGEYRAVRPTTSSGVSGVYRIQDTR